MPKLFFQFSMALVMSLSFVALAQAATITVDTAADESYTDPANGACSLREAISKAAGSSVSDCITSGFGSDAVVVGSRVSWGHTIVFDPALNGSVIEISLPGTFDDMNFSGDFDILSDLNILGNGPTNTIISAESLNRVFDVTAYQAVHFEDLTMTLGDTFSNSGSGVRVGTNADAGFYNVNFIDNKGVILVQGSGYVYAQDTVFTSNHQFRAIELDPLASADVYNSQFLDFDYGIYHEGASLYVDGSTFNKNDYGIYNDGSGLIVDGSTFSANDHGVYLVAATVTEIYNSTVKDGLLDGVSQVDPSGALVFDNSVLMNNPVGLVISGSANVQNGSLITNSSVIGLDIPFTASSVTVDSSIISYNEYGVKNYGADLDFVDSMITGNNQQGVRHEAGADLSLQGGEVSYNWQGGVFSAGYGNVDVSGTDFIGNERTVEPSSSADSFAGGLHLGLGLGTSSATIANAYFEGNESNYQSNGFYYGYGGGIYSAVGQLMVTDTIFDDNLAAYGGGALYLTGTDAQVSSADFEYNESYYEGGAISVGALANLNLDGANFYANRADGYFGGDLSGGGAMYIAPYVDVHVVNSNFDENLVLHNTSSGGGVYIEGDSMLSIENSTLDANFAPYSGGGIYAAQDASLLIDESVFTDNEATNTYSFGGAVYAFELADLNVDNSQFLYNRAGEAGAGLYVYDLPSVALQASDFIQNTGAKYGGGAYFRYSSMGMDEVVFSGNTASVSGGGLFADSSSMLVENSEFSANISDAGAGIYLAQYEHGEGETSYSDFVRIVNTEISGNLAYSLAGGLYAVGTGGTLEIANSTVSENIGAGGAGLRLSNDGVDNYLENATIAYNTGHGLFDAHVYVINTVVAHNTGDACAGSYSPLSTSYNLDDDDTCSFTGKADQSGVNPYLYVLTDNGGGNRTHDFPASSPLKNAGNCVGSTLTTDQRAGSYVRMYGGACDIGALELQ